MMSDWLKSSRSQGSDHCVEIRFEGSRVLVRDSKYLRDNTNNPAAQPIIEISAAEWSAFLATAVDHAPRLADSQPSIDYLPNGDVRLRKDHTTLTYTADEWNAFTAGITAGEFDAA